MKSSLYAVRTAFKTALTGLGLSVYDRQRKVNDYPYTIIEEQTERQRGDQGAFGQDATITIVVYNAWSSDYGERSTSDDIVDNILLSLLTKPHSLIIDGFDMPVLTCDSVRSSTQQTESQTIATTTMQFRLELFEQDLTFLVDDLGNYITTDAGLYLITD